MHTDATSVADTDWGQVVRLYDQLMAIDPTPVVALNRAVAVAETDGPAAALGIVDGLDLTAFHAFHAVRADLLGASAGTRRPPRRTKPPWRSPTTSRSGASWRGRWARCGGSDSRPARIWDNPRRCAARAPRVPTRHTGPADTQILGMQTRFDAILIVWVASAEKFFGTEVLRLVKPIVNPFPRPVRRGPQHGLDARSRARPCSEPGEPCRRGVHAGGRDADPTGFTVAANRDAIGPGALDQADVLVIAHPAAHGTERSSGLGSPVLAADELDAIEEFVRAGGGLVVLAECDQDVYGSNLTELLGRFGVGVVSTTVQDPARRHNDVSTWVLADLPTGRDAHSVLTAVSTACFYRAGALDVSAAPDAAVLARSSGTAHPAGVPLAVAREVEQGRVVVFADSDLFGDDSIHEFDHAAWWANVVTWAAGSGARDIGPWWGGVGQGRGRLGERGGGRDPQRGRRR